MMIPPSSRRYVIDMYSSRYPLWCMPAEHAERIGALLPDEWELVRVTEEADGSGDGVSGMTPARLDALGDAEIYCGFGVPREAFTASDRLRWVHSGAAGVGGSLYPELRESDAVFTNSAGVHAVPVAEHSLALIFAFARALDQVQASRRAGRVWDRDRIATAPTPVAELSGAVIGVIGYGGIGREVGRRARGLGMRVWAVKRRLDAEGLDEVERVFGPDELDELLQGSDFVVIAAPHTPETDRLIGARELGLMKESAVLVNVARGAIVDEEALIEALEERRIRGAGLDVFDVEPVPESSPLWKLDNAYLTPHIGGVSPNFWERETELILENTRRYLAGEPLLNVVDKQRGY